MTNLQLYNQIKKCVKNRVCWDREVSGYHVHYNFYDNEIEIKSLSKEGCYHIVASIDIAYFWVFRLKCPLYYKPLLEIATTRDD